MAKGKILFSYEQKLAALDAGIADLKAQGNAECTLSEAAAAATKYIALTTKQMVTFVRDHVRISEREKRGLGKFRWLPRGERRGQHRMTA